MDFQSIVVYLIIFSSRFPFIPIFSLQITITASAFPNEKDGPTVPAEVQMLNLVVAPGMLIPTFSDKGEKTAYTEMCFKNRFEWQVFNRKSEKYQKAHKEFIKFALQ